MRLKFLLILLVASATLNAQSVLQGGYIDHFRRQSVAAGNGFTDSTGHTKWSLNKYMGISSSIGFFSGGNATVLSVPVGIQLTRRLSNNWYAFAAVAAAPAYINFNHAFINTGNSKTGQKNNFFSSSNRFDIYQQAALGLMYTNDQKTFSISGSISVDRGSYPMVPFIQPGTMRPTTFITPNR